MNRNLEMLKHALDLWKRGQIDGDLIAIKEGARAIEFWRDMEAAAQYQSKITSEGTK
jgi:hypothetical protein